MRDFNAAITGLVFFSALVIDKPEDKPARNIAQFTFQFTVPIVFGMTDAGHQLTRITLRDSRATWYCDMDMSLEAAILKVYRKLDDTARKASLPNVSLIDWLVHSLVALAVLFVHCNIITLVMKQILLVYGYFSHWKTTTRSAELILNVDMYYIHIFLSVYSKVKVVQRNCQMTKVFARTTATYAGHVPWHCHAYNSHLWHLSLYVYTRVLR